MTDEKLLLRLLSHNLRPREREAFESMLRGLVRYDALTLKQRMWAETRLCDFEPNLTARVLDDLPPASTLPAPAEVDSEVFAGPSEQDPLAAVRGVRLPDDNE